MAENSRGRKAAKNTFTALVYEAVALVCGLTLPRLILSTFGSSYNGITNSITQFLSCIALLKAGIGGVTQAALYKPLSTDDFDSISKILRSTEIFMKRVALIFAGFLVVFACIYPFFVSDDFEWLFSFSLVLILGISTFAQYYFDITYQMLLTADQRQDAIYGIQILTTIANTVVSAILIKLGCSIHVVKLGSALVFCLNPILTNIYVRSRYKIRRDVEPDNSAMKQRWDAFAHEVANFVNTNTDVMVLTIFEDIRVVSVYTVYHMVTSNISKLLMNTMGGIRAAFGNMIAKKQQDLLNANVRMLEMYVLLAADILFIITGLTIVPFVMVYTSGVEDVEYERTAFAIISTIAAYFSCVRLPYTNVVQAAGHFRQTRNGAILEAVINIVVSVSLVYNFGLIGVSIGTLCAAVFRTSQYSVYASTKICKRSMWLFLKHIISSMISTAIVVLISTNLFDFSCGNYFQWVLLAVEVGVITAVVVLIVNLLLFRKDMGLFVKKVKGILIKAK